MIEKFKILVPYVYGVGPQIGTTFDTKGKSVLITGKEESGKSSLLHMIAQSIKINRERNLKEPIYMANPNSDLSDTPRKKVNFEGLSNKGQEFLFNANLFKNRIPKQLLKEFYGHNIIDGGRSQTWDQDKHGVRKFNKLIETLDAIADEIKVPNEQVYGVAYLIASGHATRMENPLTEFFYAKIQGNIEKPNLILDYNEPGKGDEKIQENISTYRRIGNKWDEDYNDYINSLKGLSAGQFQMKKLDWILSQQGSIAILDEPFANLSEDSVNEYSQKFIDENSKIKGRSQYFLTSHNSKLNDQLRAQYDWIEINLN